MVAAQVLEIDYPVYVKSAVKPDSSINKLPEVQRVRVNVLGARQPRSF